MPTRSILFAAFALALLIGAAPDVEQAPGRYKLTPAEGGAFLRLDTHTGATSLCHRKTSGWVCEAIPDDRRALEAEIDRLGSENRQLQGAIKRLEELLALPDADGKRAHGGASKFKLPSEQDVDRAVDYFQRMLRKFRDKMRELEDGDRRNL